MKAFIAALALVTLAAARANFALGGNPLASKAR